MSENMTDSGLPAEFVVIGRAETPWAVGHCPKNMAAARATGQKARILIDPAFRDGLAGLEAVSHIIAIGWFGGRKRLGRETGALVQHPAHLAEPRGVFALRSPVRPNPLALSIAKIEALNLAGGEVHLEALDWFDGTPVLDLKPYYASTDAIPDAKT